jgi:hypothetical protein
MQIPEYRYSTIRAENKSPVSRRVISNASNYDGQQLRHKLPAMEFANSTIEVVDSEVRAYVSSLVTAVGLMTHA